MFLFLTKLEKKRVTRPLHEYIAGLTKSPLLTRISFTYFLENEKCIHIKLHSTYVHIGKQTPTNVNSFKAFKIIYRAKNEEAVMLQ